MSMRENLKNKREEFWKELISDVKYSIEAEMNEYQQDLEYGPEKYEVELYVEDDSDLIIYLMIDEDQEVRIAAFKNYVAVMEFLSRICIVLESEGIEIFEKIDNIDFSGVEKITLCKGKISL